MKIFADKPATAGLAISISIATALGASGARADQSAGLVVQVERPAIVAKAARHGDVVREYSLTHAVPMADLKLDTTAGAMELERRIEAAAAAVCGELERTFPAGSPAARSCAVSTVQATLVKVRAALGAARSKGA